MRTVGLEVAKQMTESILRQPIADITPDAILSVMMPCELERLDGWELLDDLQIAETSNLLADENNGAVLVITEASFFLSRGAFVVDASELAGFIGAHLGNFGESFVNGDAVVVFMDMNKIWLFHHEGCYKTLFL